MGTLIDSSILVAAERGKLDLAERLASLGEDAVALAARLLLRIEPHWRGMVRVARPKCPSIPGVST